MDKASKAIIQNLMNELAIERQLADQLADATGMMYFISPWLVVRPSGPLPWVVVLSS